MIVYEYLKSRKAYLEKGLEKYLPPAKTYPPRIHEAMRYSVLAGGKRMRPILLFAVYEMLKQRTNLTSLNKLLPAAVALEFVHTASLIHDDLPMMDNSKERRGKPSLHVKYDNATAILAGDALITKAFEILSDINDKSIAVNCVKILGQAISTRGMIGGQTVDLISASKKININTLRYIHLKKTGSLLQAATDMACAFYGADDNLTITLGNYAIKLGLSYQIVDDILDEVGSFDILGKAPGEDSRNMKYTYPTILGLEQAKKTAEKLLRDAYNLIKNMPNNEILVELVDMIKERIP